MGDPMELNFGGAEMQKRNIPTVRVTRVDEKKSAICLVIMSQQKNMETLYFQELTYC